MYVVENDEASARETTSKIPIWASNFNRYLFSENKEMRLITPYRIEDETCEALSSEELKSLSPASYERLKESKSKLEARKQFRSWHLFSAPRSLVNCTRADILVPLLADRGRFTLLPEDLKGKVALMASGGFGIRITHDKYSPCYILGLINSKLLFWELGMISNVFRGGWITCTKQYFGKLPIRPINFNNPDDVAKHDKMVSLVERMLELHRQKSAEGNPNTLKQIETQIQATDRQIDRLVYELYELTDEEIALVEQNSPR